MAYFLEYGNWTTPRYLVITTQDDGDTITEWNEILGQRAAVQPRFDGDTKDLYAPIIKTSLEVTLFRQNATEFEDIIEGNDKEIRAYVTTGARLTADYKVPANATLLFKGNLTFGTWTEKYAHVAPIKLTFHDRIGYMAEEKFLPLKRYMNFIEIVGECLINVVAADKWLVLNWLYSYTEDSVTYEYADEFYYDIASYVGKSKLSVMEDLLESHGMQLLTDFAYRIPAAGDDYKFDPNLVADVGAIRIRTLASQAESVNTQSLYQKKQTVVGSTDKYYYELEDVEVEVITETQISTLRYGLFDTPTQGTSPSIIISFQILEAGIPVYLHVVYKNGESSLTPAEEVALGLDDPNDIYRVVSALIYTDINTALTQLIDIYDYTLTATSNGAEIVADLGGTEYDFSQVTISNTVGWIEYEDYTTGQSVITDGKFDEIRTERTLNTPTIPLLDNNTSFQIDTRAKEIVATNDYEVGQSIVFPDELVSEYLITSNESNVNDVNAEMVLPLSFKTTAGLTSKQLFLEFKSFIESGFVLPNSICKKVGGNVGIAMASPTTSVNDVHIFGTVLTTKIAGTSLDFEFGGFTTNSTKCPTLYCLPVALRGGKYYYYNGSSWPEVTASSDINFSPSNGLSLALTTGQQTTSSVSIDHPTATASGPYLIFFLFSAANSEAGTFAYLTKLEMSVNSVHAYPDKLILTTRINEKNRQSVNLDAKFYNVPEIADAEGVYRNGVFSVSLTPLYTVNYNSKSQTLLAHVSDMYAQNYAFNRWILKAKIQIEQFRLHDLFTLDEKSFIFVNGMYDERRGLLDGTFIEVMITGRQPAWQWLTELDMEWQDGNRILHQ